METCRKILERLHRASYQKQGPLRYGKHFYKPGVILPIGNDIIKRQIETMDLIAADSVDRRAIETKFEEIQSLQQSMHQRVVEHLLENKQILDPAQRAKFFEVLKSRIRDQGAPGPPWIPANKRKSK